jgi:DNA-nicking Smr family endonuclease
VKKRGGKTETKGEKGFSSTPFTSLKGVKVSPEPAVSPAPVAPVQKISAEPSVADDSDLFLRAMADVRSIRGAQKEKAVTRNAPLSPPQRTPGELFDTEDRRLFLETIGRLKMDVTFSDQIPGVDGKPQAAPGRMRQLKRGTIRIDYELDLHGLTREEAVAALGPFIEGAHRRGQQAVLVITGKGINSEGEPVLQRVTSSWLRDKGRNMVAEFAPAPRELGGEGALVVFLRAPKKRAT